MDSEPIYVSDLKTNELKEFLDSFDHVFSDCDGVIWEKAPLPGSGDFFKVIEKLGKTVNFVSNNSLRSKENYEAQFKEAHIENGFERLTIPSVAIAEYLKSVNFTKKVYCMTCSETIRVLNSYGFSCKDGPELCPDYYGDYAQFFDDDEEIGAVVLDSDFKVNIPKLYKAMAYLKRPEVIFLNGATDKYVPLRKGLLAPLGPGVFTDFIVKETNREPIFLGKPGKMFGEFALKRAGFTDPSRVLFIGDMIEQDVGLGKATGFKTLLVLTNNSKETMLAHKTIRPDFYAQSLGSLVPLLQTLV